MNTELEPKGANTPGKLESIIKPFLALRDKVRQTMDERQIGKWQKQLETFEPGSIDLGRYRELSGLSRNISAEERLARIELIRAELEILISHIETHDPWWKKGADERLGEVSEHISEVEALDDGARKLAEAHKLAQELSKLVRATLDSTEKDYAN